MVKKLFCWRDRTAARTKNIRADADKSRALGDSGFHIARHAHRQTIEPKPLCIQLFKGAAQFSKRGALLRRIISRHGDRHKPAQPQARQLVYRCHQRGQLAKANTRLGRFIVYIYLHTDIQRWEFHRALFAQALGNFQSVNRVHPAEVRRHRAGFVGLDGADKVPFNIGEISQPGLLIERLLQVTLAKRALPPCVCLDQCLRRLGFAHSDQLHSLRISSCGGNGSINSCGDFRELVVYLVHIPIS